MTALARLSRREKVLLGLLFLAAVPLALWALVLVPLQDARDRAIGALAGAQADYVWVAEQAQQFAAQTRAPAAPEVAAVGLAGVETALIEAGLRESVTALEAAAGGTIRLQLGDVAFDTFGRFLDATTHQLGYAISDLRIVRGTAPGRVNASLGLEPL